MPVRKQEVNTSHEKFPCEKCGLKFRHLHGPSYSLCYNCARKHRIPMGPKIFNEPINKKIKIDSIGITTSQYNVLIKRLEYLYPLAKGEKKLKGVIKYIRELVLNDLMAWELGE